MAKRGRNAKRSNSAAAVAFEQSLTATHIDARIAHSNAFHNNRQRNCASADHAFNDNDRRGELLIDGKRCDYSTPPAGKTNLAWAAKCFLHHLAPARIAGLVLPDGLMFSGRVQ